jgi:hypothetical protein
LLNIGFNLCRAILFGVTWNIQVAIQVKPICVRNAFRCATVITFDWRTVDSSDSANIYHLSLSSREVFCRQSCWQRRSF